MDTLSAPADGAASPNARLRAARDGLGFSSNPLDRAGEIRSEPGWIEAQAAREGACFLPMARLQALISATEPLTPLYFSRAGFDLARDPDHPPVFLGLRDGAPYFAFAVRAEEDFAAGGPMEGLGAFHDVRSIAPSLNAEEAAILAEAKSLLDWNLRHGFCANCGAASAPIDGGWKRACRQCKAEHFPRIDPVTIMLPVQDKRCCLGRQARFPPGMFSAFAGFVELGETLEAACARELYEEAGLSAARMDYVASQPWPYPSSLMIGFIAHAAPGDGRADGEEIVEIAWFSKEEARALLGAAGLEREGRMFRAPPPLAMAHHLVKAWTEADA